MKTSSAFLVIVAIFMSVPTFGQDSMILKDSRFIDDVKIRKTDLGYAIVYKNGEINIPADMVKECFIEGKDGFVPRNDKEKEKVAKGLVPYAGRWIKKKKRNAILAKKRAKRQAKYEEIKSHREWRNRYKTKGKQFNFEYTLDPDIFKNLDALMNTYYKVFMKDWRLSKP